MARGKSNAATGDTGKKRGRGRPSKKDSEPHEVDDVIDAEADSDNETTAGGDGDVDTGELPAIPKSAQAIKKVIIAPKGMLILTSLGKGHINFTIFRPWICACVYIRLIFELFCLKISDLRDGNM